MKRVFGALILVALVVAPCLVIPYLSDRAIYVLAFAPPFGLGFLLLPPMVVGIRMLTGEHE